MSAVVMEPGAPTSPGWALGQVRIDPYRKRMWAWNGTDWMPVLHPAAPEPERRDPRVRARNFWRFLLGWGDLSDA